MRSNLKLVASRPAERVYGSERFISLTRQPNSVPPARFVPTEKAEGDVVI